MTNCFNYPNLGFGLGLRAAHYDDILATRPRDIDWFEIISENFLEAHNGYLDFLADLRRDYPIVMHGVSLSIGSTDPLNARYLDKLKSLAERIDAPWISDHLCWTGTNGRNTHDLLPVPTNAQTLRHITERVREVQERLGRRIVLENPSTYLEFTASDIPEPEFLARLAEAADCGLLLDINNVYVSAFNHGSSAKRYIDTIPADRIVQIHLAGHQHHGTHIIDTHDTPVLDAVWELYRYTLATKGPITTMIEWDDNIPTLATLTAELDKARACASTAKAAT